MKKILTIAALLCFAAPFVHAAPEAVPATKPEAAEKKTDGESSDTANARTWQNIFSEAGRRVEIDAASIKKGNDGKVSAYGRIVFDKPLPDAVSGGAYQILEAQNVYDCEKRSFATQKRVFRKDEKTLVREEVSPRKGELPVRSGTLDERMLRAACRPGAGDRAGFGETVAKAKAAAEAHGVETRKELLRTELGTSKTPTAVAIPTAGVSKGAKAATKTPAKAEQPPAAGPTESIHWSYEGPGGPENWGKIDPANKLCDSGKRQSPIDIRDGIRVDLETIAFNYRPSHFRIIDNGHSIQAAVSDNRISLMGKDFELVQFHFHRPSEERIEGRSFEMVAHLVHKAHDGQIAVLAVLIERGREHPLIQTLWNHLPLERHQDVYPPGVAIDLTQLLPEKRGYYTYMGSLTTPPCSENVLWMVMQTPIQASAEQIAIFSRFYPHNARPVQPRNNRLIKESR